MSALLFVLLIGMAGFAIDAGRIYVAKLRLARSVDSAALAGALELPDMTVDSDGDGDTVASKVDEYLDDNEPNAYLTEPATSPASRQVQVKARLDVDTIFLRVIPGAPDSIPVTARATAGFGRPLEVGLVLDETGSMAGDPLDDLEDAAQAFVDTLLPDGAPVGGTTIALVPYRARYSSSSSCTTLGVLFGLGSFVRTNTIVNLTNNKTTLNNGIEAMTACGYTNVCEGLNQAMTTMNTGHDPEAERILVLLTDGDNNPGPNDPAGVCDPVGTSSSHTEDQRDKDLDTKTWSRVTTALEPASIEIYVVGLSVAGSSNNNFCDTSMIGNLAHADSTSDRNLLKCIASSDSGTNNHYFETSDSSELEEIFQSIAGEVGFRLLE
jgi:Flp pilus assembly protein TadG